MFKLSDLEKKNKTKVVFIKSLNDEVTIRKLTALETKEYQMMQIGKDRRMSVNEISDKDFISKIKLTTDEIVKQDYESACFLIASGMSVEEDINLEDIKNAKFTDKQFQELFNVIRAYSDMNLKKINEAKDFLSQKKVKNIVSK